MTEGTHKPSNDTPDAPTTSDVDGLTSLDKLPSLDQPGAGGSLTGEDPARDDDPSLRERQDPDHIGVDWDLTERTRD